MQFRARVNPPQVPHRLRFQHLPKDVIYVTVESSHLQIEIGLMPFEEFFLRVDCLSSSSFYTTRNVHISAVIITTPKLPGTTLSNAMRTKHRYCSHGLGALDM